jgi:hypothetical protein
VRVITMSTGLTDKIGGREFGGKGTYALLGLNPCAPEDCRWGVRFWSAGKTAFLAGSLANGWPPWRTGT